MSYVPPNIVPGPVGAKQALDRFQQWVEEKKTEYGYTYSESEHYQYFQYGQHFVTGWKNLFQKIKEVNEAETSNQWFKEWVWAEANYRDECYLRNIHFIIEEIVRRESEALSKYV